MPGKDGLIILERGLLKKNVKITEEVADEFPDTIKKIIAKKGCLPGHVLNAGESIPF